MNTRYFTITDPARESAAVEQAADILRRGGLLAIPTETVYGLGADGLNADAVRHIFEAKGRPQDNPLILHIPDASWLARYCKDVPETAYRLAGRFWPGPLTMILPKADCVPLVTTGGLETVGMRCPDHAVTRAIIAAAGVSICPDRKVSEMSRFQLAHVRLWQIHIKPGNPFFIGRILIPYMGANLLMERRFLGFSVRNRISLYEDIVIETIVSMQNRHHSCNLCPVPDMIRSIPSLLPPLYPSIYTSTNHGKCPKDQIM